MFLLFLFYSSLFPAFGGAPLKTKPPPPPRPPNFSRSNSAPALGSYRARQSAETGGGQAAGGDAARVATEQSKLMKLMFKGDEPFKPEGEDDPAEPERDLLLEAATAGDLVGCVAALYTGGGNMANDDCMLNLTAALIAAVTSSTKEAPGKSDPVSCCKMLMVVGACIGGRCKAGGDTPIIAAAKTGHGDTMRVLLEHSGVNSMSRDELVASLNATVKYSFKDADEMFAANADADVRSAYYDEDVNKDAANGGRASVPGLPGGRANRFVASSADAVSLGGSSLRSLQVEDEIPQEEALVHGITALTLAAYLDHLEVARVLLEVGANDIVHSADAHGHTALHYASEYGHTEVAKALISVGGTKSITAVSDIGDTALHLAAHNGHVDVVTALLAAGGESIVNKTNGYRDTPLILAGKLGHAGVAAALLAVGGPGIVNTTDEDGLSALIYASAKGHSDVVEELLRVGGSTSVNAADDFGWSSLLQTGHRVRERAAGELLAAQLARVEGAAVSANS